MLNSCRSAVTHLIQGLILLVVCCACRAPDSPEAQVRQALERMELAAETRDLGKFKDGISGQYHDDEGRGAADIANLARGYFVLNQSIHLLSRIEQIDFPAAAEARVKLTIGMIGKETDVANAWQLAGDIHDFDVTLVNEDGDWRILYARWRRPG